MHSEHIMSVAKAGHSYRLRVGLARSGKGDLSGLLIRGKSARGRVSPAITSGFRIQPCGLPRNDKQVAGMTGT
jgi:hypothetical protein